MNIDYYNAIMSPHIIVDTREVSEKEWERTHSAPIPITEFRLVRDTLPVGDYGIIGFSKWDYPAFIIERKEKNDFCACMGNERARFEREVEKMRQFRFRALLVECDRTDIVNGFYQSQISPATCLSTVDVFSVRAGLQTFWCGNKAGCARQVENLVRMFCQGIVNDVERLERAHRGPESHAKMPPASGDGKRKKKTQDQKAGETE